MLQWSLWTLPSLLALLILAEVFRQIGHNRSVPGTNALRALLAAAIVWACSEALRMLLPSEAAQRLLITLSFCCASVTPLAWLAFALAFGLQRLDPVRPAINLLGLPMLLIVLAAVTNDWHGLVWTDFSVVHSGDITALIGSPGPVQFIQFGVSAMLILAATSILIYILAQASSFTEPALLALTAWLAVTATATLELMPTTLPPWLDLATPGYALAALCLRQGVLRRGLLSQRRVVRDQVVDVLSDGVLVLDAEGVVVDANASGLSIVGLEKAHLEHRNIRELITSLPLGQLNERQRAGVELTLNERAYEVNTSPLNPDEPELDSVLVFRDVTKRREQEQQLKAMKHELEEIAHTDSLTRLCNRRIFMRRLDEEIERVRRHNSSLSVVLFDLDHFKAINDNYGHDAGDQVLRTVGRVTARHTRVTDVAARIGGEEFALLLPETQREGALQLAHRLRKSIEAARTPQELGFPLEVTASIGVATATRDSRHLEEVLKRADTALYDAKANGRNRVAFLES